MYQAILTPATSTSSRSTRYPYKYHVFAHCHPEAATTAGGDTAATTCLAEAEDPLKTYEAIDFRSSDVATMVLEQSSMAKEAFSQYEDIERNQWCTTRDLLSSQSKLVNEHIEEHLTENFKKWLTESLYDDHDVEVYVSTDKTALEAAFQETADKAKAAYVRPRPAAAAVSKNNAYRTDILGLTERDD